MKVAENGICIMMKRSYMRPSYRNHHGDPVRWLLATVVYRAIRDCSPRLSISPADRAKAADLIDRFGIKRCERQLSFFPRRCELARASEEGLRNPSGLFIRSVQRNWQPPTQTQKNSPKTWYSKEEFNRLIQH